jgi:hypothetical protein
VKYVIAQSVLAQSPSQVREIGLTMGYPITVTSIGNPFLLGVGKKLPQGRRRCRTILLLLLLLGTLSNIVPHLSTSKASHCARVSLSSTATLLWFAPPSLGTLSNTTLADILLALCPKSKILITLRYMLLSSRS